MLLFLVVLAEPLCSNLIGVAKRKFCFESAHLMDPQTASEAGVQERTVGASSSKTTSVTASASSFTIAGSEGSRSQREPLPSKNSTSGGLSSLSMLVDLLDSASSVRQEDYTTRYFIKTSPVCAMCDSFVDRFGAQRRTRRYFG